MDFTREPIIETVITPREGCKLVVRSSKSSGQEEYFVDALEVVSFGNSFFFRSLERPKSFIVPTSDYEVLEVREARMVLKTGSTDRTIKIAGGRETQRKEADVPVKSDEADKKSDKKRDRKRQQRKRRGRGREEGQAEISDEETTSQSDQTVAEREPRVNPPSGGSIVSSLLPPPPTLISESIQRYKSQELFLEEADEPAVAEDDSLTSAQDVEPTVVAEEEETFSQEDFIVEVDPSDDEEAIVNTKEETPEEL